MHVKVEGFRPIVKRHICVSDTQLHTVPLDKCLNRASYFEHKLLDAARCAQFVTGFVSRQGTRQGAKSMLIYGRQGVLLLSDTGPVLVAGASMFMIKLPIADSR